MREIHGKINWLNQNDFVELERKNAMRVYHPQGMYNNMPPENVFLAADEMGNEIGVGYIIRVMQPNIFPDRPVNLYISMECQPVARYMLFGALVARARQMRDENPQLRARVYTGHYPRRCADEGILSA